VGTEGEQERARLAQVTTLPSGHPNSFDKVTSESEEVVAVPVWAVAGSLTLAAPCGQWVVVVVLLLQVGC
jgi:hypothetical protein